MPTETARTNRAIYVTIIIVFLGVSNIGLIVWNHAAIDRNYAVISDKTADRWTKSDHRKWLEELKKSNPDLNIP